MLQSSSHIDDTFRRAVAAAQANDHSTAYHLLKQVLVIQPRNEQAWLWLSGVVESDAERRYCLEQVVMRNPSHTAAQRGLDILPHVIPVSPFAHVTAPENPAIQSAQHLLDVLQTPDESVAPAISEPVEAPAPMLFEQAVAEAGITREELLHLVELELARKDDVELATREICQRFGFAWNEVQKCVEEVRITRSQAIARRQGPVVIIIGLLTLLVGIALLATAGSYAYFDLTGSLEQRAPMRRAFGHAIDMTLFGIGLVISALLSIGYNIWKMIKK